MRKVEEAQSTAPAKSVFIRTEVSDKTFLELEAQIAFYHKSKHAREKTCSCAECKKHSCLLHPDCPVNTGERQE